MNYSLLLVLLAPLACVYGEQVKPFSGSPSKLNQHVLSKINWEELRTQVEKEIKSSRLESVEADVTTYALEILKKVGNFIIQSGLDPMTLPDEEIDLLPGSLKLTQGILEDLSTITAADKVIVQYIPDTGILELTLPLGFETVLITYDYKITVLLVSVSGSVSAKVSNLKIDLNLGFNFSEYHAFLDKIDVKDSGSITVNFSGLGVFDYLLDLLTNSVTTLFHGIILGVVNAIIYDPISDIVDQLNTAIDNVLHPNSSSTLINLY